MIHTAETMNEAPEVIFSYSRANAIEDGVLVDITDIAKEAGIKLHTACTETVHNLLDRSGDGQSFQGRAWDMFAILRVTISQLPKGIPVDTVLFSPYFLDGRKLKKVQLKAMVGPGDNGEPVMTIMFPCED